LVRAVSILMRVGQQYQGGLANELVEGPVRRRRQREASSPSRQTMHGPHAVYGNGSGTGSPEMVVHRVSGTVRNRPAEPLSTRRDRGA
jgi:hypothetical protein